MRMTMAVPVPMGATLRTRDRARDERICGPCAAEVHRRQFGQRAHVLVGRLSFNSRGTPSQMDGNTFVAELAAFQAERLAPITAAGEIALTNDHGDPEALLKVALANEVSVSELAALWIAT